TALAQEIPLGDSISIDGGLCSNGYFCQFLADVLQKQITLPANPELTATGTALMAAGVSDPLYSAPEKTYAPQTARTQAAALFENGLSRARGWH
ncbi:hypothetical protein MNBD_ALPHA07-2328, partial [hydrothermal vent metagenome]